MEGEYLSLDTAKKIVEQDKEIERLKKREQECIDHYLVQCKYASEMEDKYITANNIINELLKKIQFYKTTEWGLRGYGILENFENILNGGDVKSDR